MIKKSMFLSIQILMVLGLLLTGCETDNSTEPVTVDDNPVNLSKSNLDQAESSSQLLFLLTRVLIIPLCLRDHMQVI